MDKLGQVIDIEWQQDIDEIGSAYRRAIVELAPTMTAEELNELLSTKMTTEEVNALKVDPEEVEVEDRKAKQNANTDSEEKIVAVTAKNMLGIIDGCNDYGGDSRSLYAGGDSETRSWDRKMGVGKFSSCVLNSGLLGSMFELLGSTIASPAGKRAIKHAENTMSSLGSIESILTVRSTIGDIIQNSINANANANSIKATKALTKLKKWNANFESITATKLYDKIDEFKKAILKGAVDKFRETFQNNIFNTLREGIQKGLARMAGKFGTKLGTSSVGKFLMTAGSALKKGAGKVAGTVLTKMVGKFAFGVLDLGMAIWDMVDGIQSLQKGSPVAKTFKQSASKLEQVHFENEEAYHGLLNECVVKQTGKMAFLVLQK